MFGHPGIVKLAAWSNTSRRLSLTFDPESRHVCVGVVFCAFTGRKLGLQSLKCSEHCCSKSRDLNKRLPGRQPIPQSLTWADAFGKVACSQCLFMQKQTYTCAVMSFLYGVMRCASLYGVNSRGT